MNAGENVLIRLTCKDDNGDIIPVNDIKTLLVSVLQSGRVVAKWIYEATDYFSGGMRLQGNTFEMELLSVQTRLLLGKYDLRVETSVTNTLYFASGAETDVAIQTAFVEFA